MMSRKHYRAIAEVIKRNNLPYDDNYRNLLLSNVAQQMVFFFERDNSRFDREKFLKACGFEEVL